MNKELTVMQQFLKTLDKVGGVCNVDEIKDKVDLSNAILLNDENEIYTPVFQFTYNSKEELVMHPIVEHILTEIRNKTTYSAVRLCNFFTVEHIIPHIENPISVFELIQNDMNIDQHEWLDIRLQNVGTNNLL